MPLNAYLKEHERECVPEWLVKLNKDSAISMDDFFASRVVFYPGSGRDGRPVRIFGSAHAAHCFVYCDYGITREELVGTLDQMNCGRRGSFKGYTTLRRQNLGTQDILPTTFRPTLPLPDRIQNSQSFERRYLERNRRYGPRATTPYAFLEILERSEDLDDNHGPERLAILFLYADAYAAFDALFSPRNANHPPPFALFIENYGLQFGGGNWDRFDHGGYLEGLSRVTAAHPVYILLGRNSTAWDQYEQIPKTSLYKNKMPR
jgi:hypothetical protein